MHQIASRHYAFEGRCFVLAAGLLMKARDLPAQLPIASELSDKRDQLLLRGGSAIIGPDGGYIVGPLFDEERIIFAELDLKAIDKEQMTLDVTGHYRRPDLFDLRSEEHTSELQSHSDLVCRLLLEKKNERQRVKHVQPHHDLRSTRYRN